MRRLIINADDFGWDDDTVDATCELIGRGIITSATIMTGMPATGRALAFARAHPQTSFGLHFNIVDGHRPESGEGRALAGRNGFHPSHRQRIFGLAGLLSAKAIQAELVAQLDILVAAGLKVSHVDSHGHLHKMPAIARAMKPVLAEFGIERMRRSENLYVRRSVFDVIDRIAEESTRGLLATDYFATVPAAPEDWGTVLLDRLPEGMTELGVHPGNAEPWRRRETAPLRALTPEGLAERRIMLHTYAAVGARA
jgi:hypothetical protein